MGFCSAWGRGKSLVATLVLGTLLATPFVLLSAAPAEAHCGCHGTLCSDAGKTIDHCIGEINSLKDEVAAKVNIINDVISIVNGIKTKVESIIGTLTDIALRVADIAVMIPDFFHDLVTFIAGFHPNSMYSAMVDQLDEGACENLPTLVNNLDLSVLPDFPFKEILPAQVFELDLPDLVGIDPPTANEDDLLHFKTFTDTPLSMLLDMTELPFKLPVGFAAALSTFCIDATEKHLGERGESEALRESIHHSLASGDQEGHGQIHALHQLPAAFGGFLEEVRDVVGETLDLFAGAGLGLDKRVFRELERGDAEFAAGRFRDAYAHYQRAYKEVTNL